MPKQGPVRVHKCRRCGKRGHNLRTCRAKEPKAKPPLPMKVVGKAVLPLGGNPAWVLKWDQEKGQKIIQIIQQTFGTITGAALEVGVSDRTVRGWVQQAEEDPRAPEELRAWAVQFRAARAVAQTSLRAEIAALSHGTFIDRDGNGKVRREPVIPERAAEAGIRLKAASWALEHGWPKEFGLTRMELEHSGPEGGPIEHSMVITPAAIQAAVAERFGGKVARKVEDDDDSEES